MRKTDTQKDAHLLVQMQTKVLNHELEGLLRRWYPGFWVATSSAQTTAA